VADSYVQEDGARVKRIQEPVEIVQELPVFRKISELGQLLKIGNPQGFARHLREVVAKTRALPLDALLTGQRAASVWVEFSWNGRERDSDGDFFPDLSEGRGMLVVKRKTLTGQRCRGYCQTGMRSQGIEK
jgi:hypothetical protein